MVKTSRRELAPAVGFAHPKVRPMFMRALRDWSDCGRRMRPMFMHSLTRRRRIGWMTRLTLPGIALTAVIVAGAALTGGGARPVSNPGLSAEVPGAQLASTSGSSAEGWVSHDGTQLMLNGQPWQFTGLNIPNATGRNNCWYTMDEPQLGIALDAANAGAMRAWFFQSLATTGGKRDWSSFDATLAAARARNVHVVVTLADQWGFCDLGEIKDASWYTDGYRTETLEGLSATYRDWVAEIVRRYRDDPTILSWQLLNEPEVNDVSEKRCATDAGGIVRDAEILRDFVSDVGGLIKSIDSRHLVSVGVIGGGQCGARGTDYAALHALDVVDLCEYHDYGQPTNPIPGDQWNGLQVRLNQCGALGKPLIIGEMGIRVEDLAVGATLEDRGGGSASQARSDPSSRRGGHDRVALEIREPG